MLRRVRVGPRPYSRRISSGSSTAKQSCPGARAVPAMRWTATSTTRWSAGTAAAVRDVHCPCRHRRTQRSAPAVATRRRQQDGQQDRHRHDDRDHVQRAAIAAADLAHARDQQRTEGGGTAPGRQHQAVDGPDVRRPEVVGREGRHGAEAAAVTREDEEDGDRRARSGERRLGSIQKSTTSRTNIRQKVPLRVSASEIHAHRIRPTALPMLTTPTRLAATAGADAGQLLEERRLLRDHRDSRRGVEEQQQPEAPPLPGAQRLAERELARRGHARGGRRRAAAALANPRADSA